MWVAGFTSGTVARMVKVTACRSRPAARSPPPRPPTSRRCTGPSSGSGPLQDWKLLSPSAFTRKSGIPAAVDEGAMVLLLSASKAKFGIVLTPTRSGEYRATEVLR